MIINEGTTKTLQFAIHYKKYDFSLLYTIKSMTSVQLLYPLNSQPYILYYIAAIFLKPCKLILSELGYLV